VATGTIALSKFDTAEMMELTRSIVVALMPNTNEDHIVEALSTSAKTLRRVAEESEAKVAELLQQNAEKIIETFSGCVIFDHQSVSFGDTTKGQKRLGVSLMLRNKNLETKCLFLNYTPTYSSAAEDNIESVREILANHGILVGVESGAIGICTDTDDKALHIIKNAGRKTKTSGAQFDSLNAYLGAQPIRPEMAIFQAKWKADELDSHDEIRFKKAASNFKNCSTLPSDYIFSVRFRKVISSLKVIITIFMK